MKKFTIKIENCEEASGIALLRFKGDLDSGSIGEISKCFQTIIAGSKKFVVAEMSEVGSLSSAALGEFMGGKRLLGQHDGDLIIAGLNLQLKTQLTQMNAHKIFQFYNDVRSVIQAYKWKFEGKSEALSLSFPPFLKYVPPVRQMISRIAGEKGYSRRDSFRIETIVDEICNNAVEHGIGDGAENVKLTAVIDQKKIEIKVLSISDPEKLESLKTLIKPIQDKNPLQAVDRRGRGLSLIKLLSGDLKIGFSEKGTTVHVTKFKEEE